MGPVHHAMAQPAVLCLALMPKADINGQKLPPLKSQKNNKKLPNPHPQRGTGSGEVLSTHSLRPGFDSGKQGVVGEVGVAHG